MASEVPERSGPWGKRVLYKEDIDFKPDMHSYRPENDNPRFRVDSPEEANLVSSRLPGMEVYGRADLEHELHMPVLDIDLPVHAVPSSTEGHFHLYIDRAVTWEEYADLLRALARCGIIEEGYYKAALRRGATFVRMPGVKKPASWLSEWSRNHADLKPAVPPFEAPDAFGRFAPKPEGQA